MTAVSSRIFRSLTTSIRPVLAVSRNVNIQKNNFSEQIQQSREEFIQKKKKLDGCVADHYDQVDYDMVNVCWGDGNYHLGIFPHLLKNNAKLAKIKTTIDNGATISNNKVSFTEASTELTKYMIHLGNINSSSNVIDFGCGRGKGTIELADLAKCRTIGLDIADVNMKFCNNALNEKRKNQKNSDSLNIQFVKGSFTDLENCKEVQNELKKNGKFSHVFSQQSIIHCHEFIDDILISIKSILNNKNGKLIISDWVSLCDHHTPEFQENLFKRLELTYMLSNNQYKQKLKEHGFKIEFYEDCTEHAVYGCHSIANKAKELGYKDYYETWKNTAAYFENKEVGVNLFVASM